MALADKAATATIERKSFIKILAAFEKEAVETFYSNSNVRSSLGT